MHRYSLELMILGVVVGIMVPAFMNAYIMPLLPVTIFIVIVCTFIQMDLPQIGRDLKTKAPWLNAIWNTIILTGLVFVVGTALDVSYDMMLALLTVVASAPILAAPTLAQMLGLQARTVLLATMTGTLIMPVSLYFAIFILLDSPLQLDLQAYSIRFIIYLVFPALIGYGVQKYVTPEKLTTIRSGAKNGAVFFTILFVFGVMGDYGLLLRHDWEWALALLGYNFALVAFMSLSTYGVYRIISDNETALSYSTATTTRNSFLAWIVAGPYLGNELLNLIGTVQIMIITGMVCVKISQKSAVNKASR